MKKLPTYTQFIISESLKYYNGIKQEDVSNTIEHIKVNLSPLLRIKDENIAFIGSAGKSNYGNESHNINLVIDIMAIMNNNGLDDKEMIEDFIKNQIKRLRYDYKILKNQNRIIVEWPIKGSIENGFVELHIQLSDNLNWLNFIRYAPNLNNMESKYTGKHREYFLESIVSSMDKKIINYFKADLVKEYEKFELIFDEGLTKVRKTFEGKNGYLREPRVIEDSRRLITNDPQKFIDIIFGEQYKYNDLMTLEKCIEIYKSDDFKLYKKRNKIEKIYKNKLAGLSLIYPEELN